MATRKTRLGGNGYPAAKPTLDELISVRKQANRASADFLEIDLQTALTFCDIARKTDNQQRKRRNLQSARKAYETVSRLLRKTSLSAAEARGLQDKMRLLKSELEALGEVF
ncbi:MAG TPA: hypothetical protein VGS27_05340 [Candidatus Sulfotelmatobacter sp.]|nr:hypothetical protein [Candidatus Sulfotelmatobacter sp.]